MPLYRVLKPCFMDGAYYHPDGKRPFYEADKALKPVPSHLELVPATKAKKARSKPAAKKPGPLTKEEEQAEKDAVTFVEDPKATQPVTETL